MTAQAQTAQAGLETLQIVSSGGKTHRFSVEVMRNDEERARGLMFRRFMPADRGMLFDFKVEKPVMMWMKNTYIPLDMIFVARDGRIVSIAENTEPLSERRIRCERVARVGDGCRDWLDYKPVFAVADELKRASAVGCCYDRPATRHRFKRYVPVVFVERSVEDGE